MLKNTYDRIHKWNTKKCTKTFLGERPYECPHCKRTFGQSNTLKAHIRVQHPEQFNNSTAAAAVAITGEENAETSRTSVQASTESPQERTVKSTRRRKRKISSTMVSDSPADQTSRLSAFIMVKTEEDDFSNESVSKTTSDEHNDLFQCTECFMKFLTKELLDAHNVKHTGERPFECDVCRLRFSQQFALKAHKLSHDPVYRSARQKKVFRKSCPTSVAKSDQEPVESARPCAQPVFPSKCSPEKVVHQSQQIVNDSLLLDESIQNDDVQTMLDHLIDQIEQHDHHTDIHEVHSSS